MRLAQARGYPESRGGHAGLPLESPTEVALVREPRGEGDPGEHTGAPTGVASGPSAGWIGSDAAAHVAS